MGVSSVNLGLGTHCPIRMILTTFPGHLGENSELLREVRPRLISSAPFWSHYLVTVLPFGAIWS